MLGAIGAVAFGYFTGWIPGISFAVGWIIGQIISRRYIWGRAK